MLPCARGRIRGRLLRWPLLHYGYTPPVPIPLPPPLPPADLLVADIGGTHARFGWADAHGNLCAQVSTRVASRPRLEDALDALVPHLAQARALCLAVAGQVDALGNARTANLAWQVSAPALAAHYARPVRVINDFHALALGCSMLPADAGHLLCGPDHPAAAAPGQAPPVLVIGPGTGLGAAILLPGQPPRVLPTEAGHIGLAANSGEQSALLEQLRRQRGGGHVCVEAAVSGPGLLACYRALAALAGQAPLLDSPEAVSQAALAHSDALAEAALGHFCQWLGAFAADLCLATGAQQVWLAGGIVPAMADALGPAGFCQAFQQRGVHTPWLSTLPVRVIEHGALGMRGAALAAAGLAGD